jgi:hypothetical protein
MSIPAGQTWVSTTKTSFTDVPIDEANGEAVATTQFLDAAESLTTMFDLLSVTFGPVKSDILGNVKKLRERQLAAPAESENVQDLCRNELKTKKHTATEGLLWLVRGLEFTSLALTTNQANPTQELSDSFRAAYTTTLKPHHGFMVKPLFTAAMSACPYRKDFYAKLGGDEAQVQNDLGPYLAALQRIVAILKTFLESKDAKW